MPVTKSKTSAARAGKSTEPTYRALIRTLGMMRRVMEPYFTRYGISASQWAVLRVLTRAVEDGESTLRLTDLSERLLVRPPSVTGVVERLVRNGLVARETSREDQRSKLISLTDSGRLLVERVREGHSRRTQQILAVLSRREQQTLAKLLDRVSDHLTIFNEQDKADANGESAE